VHKLLRRARKILTRPDQRSVSATDRAACCLAAYGVVSLVTVSSEVFERKAVSSVSLSLAMPSLVGTVLAARTATVRRSLIVAALIFSWLGDWVGDLSGTVSIKLAFFAAARACYVRAFWPMRSGSILTRLG
jgi:uncharacterized membrane protein YhhN